MSATTPTSSLRFRAKAGKVLLAVDEPSGYALRLTVTDQCPLYFYSLGRADSKWSKGERTVFLPAGTYQLSHGPWVVADGKTLRLVTEAEALLSLGAFDKLVALGLEDAAVSVMVGELLYARNQWVRWRYG